MPQKMNIIGKNLREFANDNFGSISELAKKLQIKPQSLQKYLTGDRLPGAEMIIKLIKLGCDANWLLTGKEVDKKYFEMTKLKNDLHKIKNENDFLTKKMKDLTIDFANLSKSILKFEKRINKIE